MAEEGRRLWRRLRDAITGEPDESPKPPPYPPMFTATRPPGGIATMQDRLFPAPGEATPPAPAPEPGPPPEPPRDPDGIDPPPPHDIDPPPPHDIDPPPPHDIDPPPPPWARGPVTPVEPEPGPPAEHDTLEIPRVEPPDPSDLRQLADELERYADGDALSHLLDPEPTAAPPPPRTPPPAEPPPPPEAPAPPPPPPPPAVPAGATARQIAVYPDRVDEPPPRSTKVPAPPVRVHDDALDRRAGPQQLTPSEALALAERGPAALAPRDDVQPAG